MLGTRFCSGNFLPIGNRTLVLPRLCHQDTGPTGFHCPLPSCAIEVDGQDSETHLVGRWEGRSPLRHQQVSRLPLFPDQLGRQARGRVWSSCRNPNPVANILEFSNQRDRLSRNVLVNTTLYLVLKTQQRLWKVARRWDTCLYFSLAKHAVESVFKQSSLKKKKRKGMKEPRNFVSQAHFHPWILFNQGHRVLSTFCKKVDFFKRSVYAIRK